MSRNPVRAISSVEHTREVSNCRGTFTIIGGSVELPEVLAAMGAAS